MKRATLITTACFTVLIAAVSLMNARAQDFIGLEKSILTFSAPVELPGMTLQAGTYVFKRPDPNSARIIQVWTGDEKKMLGHFLTIPTTRFQVTAENVVNFKESREGMTPAVHYWYYPGLETGHEFVYPKDQAMRIAARTGERVQSTEGDISANSAITPIEGAAPDTNAKLGVEAADVNVNRQASASTATVETQVAATTNQAAAPASPMPRETVGTSGQSNTAQATDANRELPRTASPLALSGLIGLLAFAGAAMMRRARQSA